jgi:hypothetical protein
MVAEFIMAGISGGRAERERRRGRARSTNIPFRGKIPNNLNFFH